MKEHGTKRSSEQVQRLIAQQAAEWLVRLEESSPDGGGASAAERVEFAQWLKTSPAHVAEYLNAKAMWEAMGSKALESLPDTEMLLQGLSDEESAEVIPLRAPLPPGGDLPASVSTSAESSAGAPSPARRRRFLFAAAATVLLAIAAATVAPWFIRALDPNHAAFETATGEQFTRILPDGSTVALNTRSRVRLNWSERYRDIYLEEGEALFEVAHDATRPFRVWTGDSVVRAVGTRFNVYRTADAVTVTVLEGRVEVTAGAAAGSANQAASAGSASGMLGAGEQARIETSESIRKKRIAAPERVVAWQSRRLIFEGEPLSEVIAEFNRYHEKPLVLGDESLGTKRIHGIFDATDRASLVMFLEEFEGVRVEVQPNAVLVR